MEFGIVVGKGVKRTPFRLMILLFLISLPFVLVSGRVQAAPGTIVVPDDYSTIQEAIDAAGAGDTVFVKQGVYQEHVYVYKALMLFGEDKNVVIDGNGTTSAWFVVNYSDCIVTGFHIRNGRPLIVESCANTSVTDNFVENCGIEVIGSSDILISYNLIKQCDTGIRTQRSAKNVLIANNSLIENSLGIKNFAPGSLVIGNFLYNNTRGMDVRGSCDMKVVENNRVYLSSNYGISISPHVRLTGNHVWKNRIGILWSICDGAQGGTFINNTIEDNEFGFNCGTDRVSQAFYHNNFVNNIKHLNLRPYWHAYLSFNAAYPVGGNYWSDYEGEDQFSGPYQNISGSDGFVDTPKFIVKAVIEEYDRYPFMELVPNPPLRPIPIPLIPHASYTHTPLEPAVNETITFDASFAHDLNGVIVSYLWDFGDGTTVTVTASIIDHFYTSPGIYNVTLTVTDNDGLSDSKVESINVGKMGSSLNISATPEVITIRETSTITGSLSPPRKHATVTLWYVGEYGNWNTLTTVTTDENGRYSYEWTPEYVYDYQIKATWEGDEHTLPDESKRIQLVCKKIVSTISISILPQTTLIGYNVDIIGALSDMYGVQLPEKTVAVYYSSAGISTWTPIVSATTDSNGTYQLVWIPPATGTFILKAEWTGNNTHSESSSETTLTNLPHNDEYVFSIESNSTIEELTYNSTSQELTFTVTGSNGTPSYVKATISKTFIQNINEVKVYLDDSQINYVTKLYDDSWQIEFTYSHSTHTATINLQTTGTPLILTLIGIATIIIALTAIIALTVYYISKRHKRHKE